MHLKENTKNSKKVTFLLFLPLFFFACASVPAISHAQDSQPLPTFVFLRDLKLGDTGEDVRELQKLLNSDIDTTVSLSGNGAPGLETLVFGPATQKAVIRFQEKYADEVLRPAGATKASGAVGLWTRLKLNQILLNGTVAKTPSFEPDFGENNQNVLGNILENLAEAENNQENEENDKLSLNFLSHYYGGAGKVITLTGSAFAKTANTVKFNGDVDGNSDFEITNVASQSGTSLKIQIPGNVKPGRYDISVSNGRKTSNTMPFMVTTPGASLPQIKKIEPAIAKFGQEIKITGENFTPRDNIVSSSFGVIRDLSSVDGVSLFFSIPRPAGFQTAAQSSRVLFTEGDSQYWPVRIFVYNENGISPNTDAARLLVDIK